MSGVRQASADRIVTGSREHVFTETLGQVLAGRSRAGVSLAMPLLQRRYCWGARQLGQLLMDMGLRPSGEFRRPAGAAHSLGRVVLSADSRTVIDGQQRLTTACLVLAAIRWASPSLVGAIQGVLFPHRADRGDGIAVEDVIREEGRVVPGAAVVPTWLDRRAFWRCLLVPPPDGGGHDYDGGGPERTQGDEEDSIGPAFALIRTRIAAIKESSLAHTLQALKESLLERTTVLHFQIREADIFSAYERLAFRDSMLGRAMYVRAVGVSLGECDLVRNYLLSFFADADESGILHVFHTLWLPFEKAAAQGGPQGEFSGGRGRQSHEQTRRADVARMNAVFAHQLAHSVASQNHALKGGPSVGGSAHLFEYPDHVFPLYRKVRASLEGALSSQGLSLSPHDDGADRSALGDAVSKWMGDHLGAMLER